MRLVSRSTVAAAFTAVATLAAASGPSTGPGVADQDVSPSTFFGLLGGVAALGVVLWLGLKFLGGKKKQ